MRMKLHSSGINNPTAPAPLPPPKNAIAIHTRQAVKNINMPTCISPTNGKVLVFSC